jgi:hypothetical protein
MSAPDTPEWYQSLADEPGDFAILNLPMNWDRPGYLLYQTVHGKRLTAAYISRTDPRTLVERAPVLQNFRHLGPDVISHSLGMVAPSVFEYLGVRYVVLDGYKMPRGHPEREATERLAQEALGSLPPVFADDRLTVYRVEPPPQAAPFLILGQGWGERELRGEQPWRAIAPQSTLQVHTGRPVNLVLHFEASSDSAHELTVWHGDAVIGGFALDAQAQRLRSGRFAVPQGTSTLRLQSSGEGGKILMSQLDIEILSR